MDSYANEVMAQPSGKERYRAFRRRLLESVAQEPQPAWLAWRQDDEETDQCHPLQGLRRRVVAMREQLYWRHGNDRGLSEEPSADVRRALGIPSGLRLSYPLSRRLLQSTAGAFAPPHLMMRIARRELQNVRTYHGRRLLFSAVLHRFFVSGESLRLTDALDFALLRLEGKVTHGQLREIEPRSVHWVRAFYKLGVRTAPALLECFRQRRDSDDGPLIELLVDEKVIQAPAELAAWPARPHYAGHVRRVAPDQMGSARAVVQCLMQLGVPRAAIAKACQDDHPNFRHVRLLENLVILEEHDICVPTVAAGVGKFLWAASPQRWRFLVDVLRLRAAEDLVLFVELLRRDSEMNTDLAEALLSLQATPRGMADCQQVLLLGAEDPAAPVRALERLSLPPFSFTPSEFGRVRDFAHDDGPLEAFLDCLARHGVVAPQEVLAFERCYHRRMSLDNFARLLDIGVACRGGAPVVELADWVNRAARIDKVDACEVAADLLRLGTLLDLDRMLAVAPLGASVLRYLIVEKRVKPLDKLLRWFYHDAPGVLEVKLWGPLGDIERVMLDDAFERRRFNVVNHNVGCAYAAGRHRAAAQLRPRPAYSDRAACDAYNRTLDRLINEQRAALVQQMREVLLLTGGVLLTSLLDAGSAEEARTRLEAFKPLLADLVAGRGPAVPQLSPLEAEAVALVYGISPAGVEQLWPELVGHEQDLSALALADHYPMRWRQAHRRLRDGARLDEKGLGAIARLPSLVNAFNARWKSDMFDACKGLRPSRIDDDAADVDGLLHHLAVLCAIASGDDQVAASLCRWQDSRDGLLGGSVPYGELEHLRTFFETILPDALDSQAPVRLRRLAGEPAARLIQRLGVKIQPDIKLDRDRLVQAMAATRSRVLPVYLKWNARERGKFPKVGQQHAETVLHAVVSKTPAAFFAKEAVGLCTRHDVHMWKEARHAHLLVFDPTQRCLAGMAMLYVEVIPAIDSIQPTLVIRALNPVARYAAGHDSTSIVEAFFATAMTIAAENNLAAVAFPGDGGMHLLSNVSEIENDIRKRYVKSAQSRFGLGPLPVEQGGVLDRAVRVEATFHGYAVGGGGTVSSLYVIWRGAEAGSAQPRFQID
ncbi:hypothetical protein [Rhizobacter sp. Root1221]|uniref:hypothetical protein n=1 Tax=Rhizobacter sp. Root1221 TaxID=1736433 RepID=UPI0006FCCD28|nr:hypothetical protein [Rhizobacter sp. Root1221]KQW02920.1 hypothetical protein ASC87_00790 [Rhizobacter sp. Root1221]